MNMKDLTGGWVFLTLVLILIVLAIFGFSHNTPWTFDSKVDVSSVATFLAVVVALSVALDDAVKRRYERARNAACFVAYHRLPLELILKRIACAVGVIERHRAARLGQYRPYDHFKFSSLVVRQDIRVDVQYVLGALYVLPAAQAEKLASVLGMLPILKSDFESLAMMNPDVAINDADQDLIAAIIERGQYVVLVIKEFLGLSEVELKRLVDGYREVLVDGDLRYLAKGTSN